MLKTEMFVVFTDRKKLKVLKQKGRRKIEEETNHTPTVVKIET